MPAGIDKLANEYPGARLGGGGDRGPLLCIQKMPPHGCQVLGQRILAPPGGRSLPAPHLREKTTQHLRHACQSGVRARAGKGDQTHHREASRRQAARRQHAPGRGSSASDLRTSRSSDARRSASSARTSAPSSSPCSAAAACFAPAASSCDQCRGFQRAARMTASAQQVMTEQARRQEGHEDHGAATRRHQVVIDHQLYCWDAPGRP